MKKIELSQNSIKDNYSFYDKAEQSVLMFFSYLLYKDVSDSVRNYILYDSIDSFKSLYNDSMSMLGLRNDFFGYNKDQMISIINAIGKEIPFSSNFLSYNSMRIDNYIDEITNTLKNLLSDKAISIFSKYITKMYDAGIDETTIAKIIKEQITLNSNMSNSIYVKFQSLIDNGVSKTNAYNIIRELADKYRNDRANTIAKVELNKVRNNAHIEAIKQCVSNKVADKAYKKWNRNVFDEAINYENSITNDGIIVPIDDLFSDGSYFPGEINENCTLSFLLELEVKQ